MSIDAYLDTLRRQGEILERGYWWQEQDGLTIWWGRCARCGGLIQGAGYGLRVPDPGTAVCTECGTSKRSKRFSGDIGEKNFPGDQTEKYFSLVYPE